MLPTTSFTASASGSATFRVWHQLVLFLLLSGLSNSAFAQSFLHADGGKIVNASNQEVLLNGMNLGNYAVQEGYMMKVGFEGPQNAVKKTLYNAGMSDADVETFYQNYRNNFITKPDIDYIASKGFNCIRLPLHYELFLTPSQRAVRNSVIRGTVSYDSYVSQLTSWYNANQLFTDPNNMEAVRIIENTLSWAQANNMYVVLDMHAVPGSQGTDTKIADALVPLDLWNRSINQDILNRLWSFISARYKNDARVAMYDLINEPNNVPTNPPIHDLLQRLMNTVRGQGDNHLLLVEGNGWGNDYNYMEPFTFSSKTNLVYNSHRYGIDNGVNSTESWTNHLGLIGNLKNFRSTYNVPIWVGETGENSDAWLHEAAVNLNSVGIGWCHWTYKRFENGNNPAFMHINPPYVPDGPGGLPQVLNNILFQNCVPNSVVNAISPNQNGIVNYPGGGSYNGNGGTTPPPPATAQAVPGTIQAESFSAQSGTSLENTTDAGGGQDVGSFDTNDWLDYSVNVATAGTYTVGFRVASGVGGATLQLRNSSGTALGSINVGNTGGWQSWQTINATVTLPAGTQTLRLFAAASTGCNVNYLTFATAAGSTAFSRQLEAEAANLNNGMQVENCSEGGQDMGYVDNGDYLVWNSINFPTTGSYLIEYRVASGGGGGTISSDLNSGFTPFGNTTIPGTGGWQNWTTVSKTVTINAGTYNFGVFAQVGGWNLNWVRITKTSARGALATTSAQAAAAGVTLYPNPVESQLLLDGAAAFEGGQARIHDAAGREVWCGTYQGQAISVAGLKSGLYLLELSHAGATRHLRFAKQ